VSSDLELRDLRDALERAQNENKELRLELARVRAFDPDPMLARISALEVENLELRGRLETADRVRASWDARLTALKRELDIAREEQDRLRTVLENERLSKQK